MRKVEAQPAGRHQRAFLRDVVAEHLAQRLMQQMRRRMVLPDGGAARVIDIERQRRPRFQRALLDGPDMDEKIAGFLLGVSDPEADAIGGHQAGVAHLPAGLGIKWGLVDDHGAALARLEGVGFLAIAHQRRRDAFRLLGVVAEEFRRAELLAQGKPHRLGRGVAGAGP